MKRRQFITLLGGATAAWPLAARAQQGERMRRIGVLLPAASDDAEFQARVGAFLQGLQQSGWSIGRNVRIDTRWATANAADIRRHAAELVTLAPDVILAHGASTLRSLLQVTHSVPINEWDSLEQAQAFYKSKAWADLAHSVIRLKS